MRRIPFVTLAIAAAAAAIAEFPPAVELLQFDRAALAKGEFWRLLTGHLTHFGTEHLVYDTLVFLTLGFATELWSRRALVICLLSSAAAISALVWWLQPEFEYYRGLSGVDSGLFSLLIVRLLGRAWRDRDRLVLAVAAIGIAAFFAKSIFEFATGSAVFVASQGLFTAVPLAHLAGAAVGAALSPCAGSAILIGCTSSSHENGPGIRRRKGQAQEDCRLHRVRHVVGQAAGRLAD